MGYIFDAMKRAKDNGAVPRVPTPPLEAVAEESAPLALAQPQTPPQPQGQEQAAAAASAPATTLTLPIGDHVDDRILALTEPASVVAEEYRAIRTSILARWNQKRNLVHTITSATPQEGKTITSLNLGLSFAELRNRRTLVVEADLRLPQFANLLGLEQRPGLVDVLEESADVNHCLMQLGDTRLTLLPAGRRGSTNAIQLLSGTTMAKLIKTLRQRFDHVIIDTPPVVELADAGILGGLSDDVMLVVRMNRTPRALVEQAVRTLTSYNAAVGGLIATDQVRHHGRYYSYRYGYRYGYRYCEGNHSRKAA